MNNEIFTTSVIVHCLPERSLPLIAELTLWPNTEIAVSDTPGGKLVALIEANSMAFIQNWISDVREMSGVLSVSMIYQHSDTTASLNEVIA